MTSGEIVLTFPATCSVCRASIPLGTRVWWDARTSDISCVGTHLNAASGSSLDPRRDAVATGWPPVETAATRPSLYDQDLVTAESARSGVGRRWDPLDVDAPGWWDRFEMTRSNGTSATTPPSSWSAGTNGHRPVAVDGFLHDTAPFASVETITTMTAPTVTAPPAPAVPAAAPSVVEPPISPPPAPPPVERTERRHPSAWTTVPGTAAVAGMPPARRRTNVTRPTRLPWQPASVLHLGLGRSTSSLDRRRAPGLDRAIDHVVIAESGVWVVTVKHSRGLVERRAGGTMTQTRDRLLVGGHERMRAVRSALAKGDAVASVVGRMGGGWERVPVRPVLCFVEAEWRPFAQPLEVEGVVVVWPKQLGSMILGEPVIAPRSVDALSAHLDAHLRPA